MKGIHGLILLSLGLSLASTAGLADSNKNRDREMLRRVQQQMQQIQSQASALEEEKAKLTRDLDKAGKEAKAAQGRAYRLNRELKAERAKNDALGKDLEQAKEALAGTQERLAQTTRQLADRTRELEQTGQHLAAAQSDKQRLEGVKARQEREIALCEDKNVKLYGIGRELMTRFEHKTCNEVMAQKEPFTGLKRVEVENLMEEYRDRLDEQKLIKPPGG